MIGVVLLRDNSKPIRDLWQKVEHKIMVAEEQFEENLKLIEGK